MFRIVREEENARILVYNPYDDGEMWIDADAVGPVPPPDHRSGPKPSGVNCAEMVYDGSPPVTPGRTETLGQTGTLVLMPYPTATLLPGSDSSTG